MATERRVDAGETGQTCYDGMEHEPLGAEITTAAAGAGLVIALEIDATPEAWGEDADELGKHGPTWLWKREHGEVEVTPAEARLIRAAIDLIAERKQTRIGGGRTR